MALQTILGGLWIPQPINQYDFAHSFGNLLIDASSEKAAEIFRAPKTGTIDKIGFRTGTVITGATVDVRLETVDLTNGDPSGTLLGTNSNGSQAIANGDDNTWFTTSLTTGVAVTKGDLLAVVIANAGSGNMNIKTFTLDRSQGFPYSDLFTSSWAKNQDSISVGLEYSDGSYAYSPGVWPITNLSFRNFNSSSTPDERGILFQLPFPFRVTGVWITANIVEATDIILYDSDGTTVLESVSLDKDVRFSADTTRRHVMLFSGTQTLSANTNYRLVIKPTTTTNISIMDVDVDTAAIMDALEGGQNFHATERTDAGAWSETTTKRPLLGLFCDGFGGASQLVGGGLVS